LEKTVASLIVAGVDCRDRVVIDITS